MSSLTPSGSRYNGKATTTQTIELTSKKLKLQLLLAWAIIIVSFILMLSRAPMFILTLIGGIVYLIIVKFKIWYQHK